jgi:ketohexokinase
LPEFSCADFQAIATESFEWMHFEGRNVEETRQMLASLTDYSGTVSLEIEKPRPGIEALWPYPDVLLFGKHFVTSQGMHAEAFLPDIHRRWPEKKIFCAWGDAGAYTMVSGKFVHQPAFIPEQIVDTLGAGDTFNAGVIHALTQGATIENSLAFGVHLAGLKCGREGLLRREDNLPMGIGKSFLDAHLG